MGSAAKGSSGQHWQKQSGGVFESSFKFAALQSCSDSHGGAGPRRAGRLCSTVTQLSVCGLCAVPCGTVP